MGSVWRSRSGQHTTMSDRVQPAEPAEPTVFARVKDRLMSTIDSTRESSATDSKMEIEDAFYGFSGER